MKSTELYINKTVMALRLLLPWVLMLLLLVSCSADKAGTGGITDASEDTTAEQSAEQTPAADYSVKTDAVIISGGEVKYTVVCPSDASEAARSAAEQICGTIAGLCGRELCVASESAGEAAEEIIVGAYAFAPAKELYDMASYGSYIFQRYGNKILVAAYDDTSFGSVAEDFCKYLKRFYSDGSLTLISGLFSNKAGKVSGYIPPYTGTGLSPEYILQCGAQTTDDTAMQADFSGARESDFTAYCAQLEGSGYSKVSENSFGLCRYASYSDGSHLVSVSFYKSGALMRIVSEKEYEKSLWSISGTPGTGKVLMMQAYQDNVTYKGSHPGGYIFRLSDGRFIVFDTGYAETAKQLMDYMKSRNTFTDGKVHIALIIISHPHTDHMDGISVLASDYASEIVCEAVAYNFTNRTRQTLYSEATLKERQNTVIAAAKKLGAEYYCLRAGQRYDFAGTSLEVIFTADELGNYILTGKNSSGETDTNYDQNNSSLIVRLTVEGQTVTLTGDCRGGEATIFNKYLLQSFKSDIMTVAHHGFNVSATLQMYTQAKPSVLFWPVRTDEQDMTRYFDKQLMAASYVKKHFFEDTLIEVELPYTP